MAYFANSATGAGVLGETLSAALNVNGMLWRTSPAATELEELTMDWLRQMIGLYFGELKQKAATVFEEVCSDRLEVKQTEEKSGPQGS